MARARSPARARSRRRRSAARARRRFGERVPERQVRGDRRREVQPGAVRVAWSSMRGVRELGEACRRRTADRRPRRRRAWPPLMIDRRAPSSMDPPRRLARVARAIAIGVPLSASASGMFGVTTSARGSSSARSACDAVVVEQARRRSWRPSPDRRRRSGSSSSSIAAATASTIAAVASMPVFVACSAMSPATASICAVTRSAGSGRTRGDADRVLRGDGGDGARAVDAERGERLEVGLNAGAAARVAAGDRQRRAHRRRSRATV